MPSRRLNRPGRNVLQFLREVLSIVGCYDTSNVSHDLYHMYLKYVDVDGIDNGSYFRRRHADLRVIRVYFMVISSDLCCCCYESTECHSETEKVVYVALPNDLIGDVSKLSPENFSMHSHPQCWCRGNTEEWIVSGFDL